MLNFAPDPLYTPEELAAYNAVNELLAQVDSFFGVTGEPYFLGLAPEIESDVDYFPIPIYEELPVQLNETFNASEWLDVEPVASTIFDDPMPDALL